MCNPQSINYRGGVITWFPSSPASGYRADVNYSTVGTYRTLGAAKAALTREFRAWRRDADAAHHSNIQSIIKGS